jgi:hypothetical protein
MKYIKKKNPIKDFKRLSWQRDSVCGYFYFNKMQWEFCVEMQNIYIARIIFIILISLTVLYQNKLKFGNW